MFGVTGACAKCGIRYLLERMSRRKGVGLKEETGLRRVMSVLDLVFLGVGSMLGMGVYIMCGSLARSVGPAMVLSFALAGIAALLSALCYAEFAGRAPGTGSAYSYCYITIGEFVAFILGWNLALEFVIGTACLARGLSGYFDSILEGEIGEYMSRTMGMEIDFLSRYPDFLAFIIMLAFTALVASGVKNSTSVNNTFVVINISTISVLIVFGLYKLKIENWFLERKGVPQGSGDGGFLPFGPSSIFEGAATAFYAYTGFDTVATTGGEARNPHRTIPIALILSLSIAMTVYTSIAATFTLIWPYYDQVPSAPYPYILKQLGWPILTYVVTCGAISAIIGCLIGSIFGMARVIYSISNDGLLYKPLAKVNKRTQTPAIATIVSGLITGLIAIVFDTEQLISMTSIGTLMAYTMVGVCVLILRYQPTLDDVATAIPSLAKSSLENDENWLKERNDALKSRNIFCKVFNIPKVQLSDEETGYIARTASYILCFLAFLLCSTLAFWIKEVSSLDPVPTAIFAICLILFLLVLLIISRQPSSVTKLKFKVRPVPLLPGVSIFINVYLMLKLDKWTWVRFGIWLVIGLMIYFGYGIWHSVEGIIKTTLEKSTETIKDESSIPSSPKEIKAGKVEKVHFGL